MVGKRSIALVDDHTLFTESLKTLLEKEYSSLCVITYNNLKDFERDLKRGLLFDFVLLDIHIKEENGLIFLENNKSKLLSNTDVLMLSSSASFSTIQHSIKLGAKGFMTKNCDVEELLCALEIVKEGGTYISEVFKNEFAEIAIKQTSILPTLTPRETEVLSYLCASHTVKEIAHKLELSTNTVQMYIKSLFKKLNQNRTTDLVVFAIKNGLNFPITK